MNTTMNEQLQQVRVTLFGTSKPKRQRRVNRFLKACGIEP